MQLSTPMLAQVWNGFLQHNNNKMNGALVESLKEFLKREEFKEVKLIRKDKKGVESILIETNKWIVNPALLWEFIFPNVVTIAAKKSNIEFAFSGVSDGYTLKVCAPTQIRKHPRHQHLLRITRVHITRVRTSPD